MPQVIAGAKAVWATIGGMKIAGFAVGKVIQSAIVSFAIGRVMQELAGKPKAPTFDESLKLNNTSNVSSIPVIYGTRLVGGSEYRAVVGSKNEYLWRIMVLCEGEIDDVTGVFVNDADVSQSPYASHVYWGFKNGSVAQTFEQELVNEIPEWKESFVGSRVAYLYARLKFSTDVFPQGLPELTAMVRGAKVYDPRLDSTQVGGSGSHRATNEFTHEWSENPALCILDYLTNTVYGRAVPYEDIDIASFMTEADYCDELITLRDADGNDVPNQKRYTCNGVVDTKKESLEILKELLSSCRGALISPSDKFKLVIDKPSNAIFTFDEDNMIGGWTIHGSGVRDRKNRVQTRFFDKDNLYDQAIKLTTSSGGTDFLAQDNNRLLQAEIALPFTNEHIRADIISQHFLKQSRLSLKVSFKALLKAVKVEAMDIVYIKHTAIGWDQGALSNGKLFRVMSVALIDDESLEIQAEEYDPSVYTFDVNTPPQAPQTGFPDPLLATPPSDLTLDSSELQVNRDGTIIERIHASWTPPALAFIHHYEIAWKSGSDLGFTIVATDDTDFYIAPVNSSNLASNGQYFVKVRAVYHQGNRSSWFPSDEGLEHEVVGKSAPPNKPTGFSFTLESNYTRRFDWISPADADIRGYQIRFSETLSDLWDNMTNLHEGFLTASPFETSLLSAGTYRFAIKSIDTSGNYSNEAQYLTATLIDDPSVEILASQYPRLEGFTKVGFTGNGEFVPKTITTTIPVAGGSHNVTFEYVNKEITNDYWTTGDEEPFALYKSTTTFSAYSATIEWRLARFADNSGATDQWRVYAVDALSSNVYTPASGSDSWISNLNTYDRYNPLLGTYSANTGNTETGNITLATAYDFNNAGTQTGTGSGTVEITYTVPSYAYYIIQHSTDGFTTIDEIRTGVSGSNTTSLVFDEDSTTYTGSFRIVGYNTDGNYIDFPLTNGGVVTDSSGDLDSYASPSAEWTDLGTTTWDNWTEYGFASETLVYTTHGFEFGTTLNFKPVIQVVGEGTITTQVSIVPETVTKDSGFVDSDYGSFFSPVGAVTAKAIRIKVTMVGVNASIKTLSILLDGKQLVEELLNLDTSTLSSSYRPSAGDIYLPLQKPYNNINTIQISLIGVGGNYSTEIVSKTTTVNGLIAPRIKIHHSGGLADATIDAVVKGF